MDWVDRVIPCFGTCMLALSFMALMLLGVYAYIEWCNEYERAKALKGEEGVKRAKALFYRAINSAEVDTLIRKGDYLGEQLETIRATARRQQELEEPYF